MLDTISVNLPMVELFWDLVIAHFVSISNSKNHILRSNGVENLSILIQQASQYFLTKALSNQQQDSWDFWTKKGLLLKLLGVS